MMTDLYQLTMMQGYFKKGMTSARAVFDLFFRQMGGTSVYAVMAGLEQAIDYIRNIRFADDDLAYLRDLNVFDGEFLRMLGDIRFTGDIHAIPEGSIVFPYEPLLRVSAPVCEAQLVETALLNIINHQTLIATKANRIAMAAAGKPVFEFGLRRAHGPDAGIYGARAAVIGGCVSTSNVLAGRMFDIDVVGTHGHSWVMSFPDELSAFEAYAEAFPDNCLLLVDTYDTLRSGLPNAVKVFRKLKERGHSPRGVRLDSGDLAYLSKEARNILNAHGLDDVSIVASGDLDESVIFELLAQGARIDAWGVGTKLITSEDWTALGGVYKLAALEENGVFLPKIKISDSMEKTTNPGVKKVVRVYGEHGKAVADLIMLEGERIDTGKPLTVFDPAETWKTMTLNRYSIKELLIPVFVSGELVYRTPPLKEIAAHCRAETDTFWSEYKRHVKPHRYKVDLSSDLFELKRKMLDGQRY